MKTLVACLFLVAAAQAIDWAKVRPMHKVRPPVFPRAVPKSSRIIGGEEAEEGQFPYQVGVFMDDSYFCGGSLIAEDTVLSAGHCSSGFSKWEVHAGCLRVYDTDEPTHQVTVSNMAKVHEDYNSFFIVNDISIIYLDEALSGDNIDYIRLPSDDVVGNDLVGETCRLSGWGKTRDIGGLADTLMFVDLVVMTNEECANYYGEQSVKDTTICVDTEGGTASSCNGDSGGPLVWMEADGVYSEVGIVSYGSSQGCESGAPAAFTRVTEFLDWISENAKAHPRRSRH